MEIKQETKSLPRNRKCGNCRYFEPAPLWRKGWCRNPRLYDRRANHLVDAATIDCEQVFRARIYWEPIPAPELSEADTGYTPFVGPSPADSGQADPVRSRIPSDGVLRSRQPVNNSPISPEPANGLPVITRREKAAAAPGIVPKPSKVRLWLVENIPYYDKVDGPLSRINYLKVLPWVVLFILLLVVLLNVLGGKKDTNSNPNGVTTPNSSLVGNTTPGATAGQTVEIVNCTKNGTPTATLSSSVPTATSAPAPTPTVKAADVTAKVVGVGAGGLNMRKDPTTTAAVVTRVPEGKIVKIRSGDFKTVDGITWWPISYNGQDGWAASQYLEKVTS